MSDPTPRRGGGRQAADDLRLPPHSSDAERGVLGCLLVEPVGEGDEMVRREAMDEVLKRKIGADHFYELRHQVIFRRLMRMAEAGTPVGLMTVMLELREAGNLDEVGGITYLNEIVQAVPSAANIGYYLEVVEEKWALRRVLHLCVETTVRVYEPGETTVKQIVSRFEADAMMLSEAHVPTEFVPLPGCLPAYIDALEKRHMGKQEITGLATPFWYLNNITCGLQPRELVVIGARPSCGKTSFACDVMRYTLANGKGVLFFSVEMARQEIMGRIVAAEARCDGLKLRNGFWYEDKEAAIMGAVEKVRGWDRFLIDDRSVVTGQDVFVSARRAKRQHNIDLVVVDYLQLMQAVRSYGNRVEEVAEVSKWLKRTAKELDLAVLACAQLSRDSEKDRAGRPPLMSDLRECGQIEQDADVIGLLYEPKVDDDDFDDVKWMAHHTPDDPKEDSEWNTSTPVPVSKAGRKVDVNPAWREEFRRINLVIAKNRNGQTGPCELVFQRRSARFVDAHSPKRTKEEKGQLI